MNTAKRHRPKQPTIWKARRRAWASERQSGVGGKIINTGGEYLPHPSKNPGCKRHERGLIDNSLEKANRKRGEKRTRKNRSPQGLKKTYHGLYYKFDKSRNPASSIFTIRFYGCSLRDWALFWCGSCCETSHPPDKYNEFKPH